MEIQGKLVVRYILKALGTVQLERWMRSCPDNHSTESTSLDLWFPFSLSLSLSLRVARRLWRPRPVLPITATGWLATPQRSWPWPAPQHFSPLSNPSRGLDRTLPLWRSPLATSSHISAWTRPPPGVTYAPTGLPLGQDLPAPSRSNLRSRYQPPQPSPE